MLKVVNQIRPKKSGCITEYIYYMKCVSTPVILFLERYSGGPKTLHILNFAMFNALFVYRTLHHIKKNTKRFLHEVQITWLIQKHTTNVLARTMFPHPVRDKSPSRALRADCQITSNQHTLKKLYLH